MDKGRTIHDIALGDRASFSKTITETDVILFAGITGDLNPLHIDEEAARRSRFGRRVAHGALTASLISSVLGMKLPGWGTILLETKQRFLHPVYIGDTITATVEATQKIEEKNMVIFKCTWSNQDGTLVAEGEAVVMPPSSSSPEPSQRRS